MRRSDRIVLRFAAGLWAVTEFSGSVTAADVAEATGRGSTLTLFGIGTLVPALLVYAFFRRREMKSIAAGDLAVIPEPARSTRRAKPKPATTSAQQAAVDGVSAAPGEAGMVTQPSVSTSEAPRRLDPAGPNPLALALVAKAVNGPATGTQDRPVAPTPLAGADSPLNSALVAKQVAPEEDMAAPAA